MDELIILLVRALARWLGGGDTTNKKRAAPGRRSPAAGQQGAMTLQQRLALSGLPIPQNRPGRRRGAQPARPVPQPQPQPAAETIVSSQQSAAPAERTAPRPQVQRAASAASVDA